MMSIFHKVIFIVFIFFCCLSSSLFAQSDSVKVRKHKFAFYGGIGPNYYFNNLVIAKNTVNELNFYAVGRIMWEPAYNLSIGFESGYNRLYTIEEDFANYNGSIHIVNSAVPIMLVLSMKFYKEFYGTFTMGQSILLNKVSTSDYGGFNASSVSLGDFTGSLGYKKLLTERIYLCAEAKYFTSSKLQDKNMSLVFMGGYRF